MYGVMLDYGCDINTICKNTITHSDTAIRLSGDTTTTVFGNTIVDSSNGILLVSCRDTTILHNTMHNNTYGIRLEDSTDSIIYHNDLLDNNHSAYDSFKNTWDDAVRHEGNYWSDYTGIDSNEDGIGDTPYNIPGGTNQDLYNLMDTSELYYTLQISLDDPEVFEATMFPVTVQTLRGKVVSHAEVFFNDTFHLTDTNGTAWFTAPAVETDITYEITASRSGYIGVTETILVKNAERIGAFFVGRITNLSRDGEYLTFESVQTRMITFSPWSCHLYDAFETFTISSTKLGFIGTHYIFAMCRTLI